MNTVGTSASAVYSYTQPHPDSAGQTRHWTQSRTVRAVAGLAVIGLGVITGLTVSLFASPFAAIIAAGAVTLLSGGGIIGYFFYHRHIESIESSALSSVPADCRFPEQTAHSLPTQPPAYTSSVGPPPAYSSSYTPVLRKKSVSPCGPPPAYCARGITASEADPFELPPAYTVGSRGEILLTADDFIHNQEDKVRQLLTNHGDRFYQSRRDGNCFYDSIAHQCPEVARNATKLRRKVADFARKWQQSHRNYHENFSTLEACAYARLRHDVSYEAGEQTISNGLEEISTPGCFSDQIDSFFAAQVVRRPIVTIDIHGNITLAVDENGKSINWVTTYNRELLPANTILLIQDGAHFMGKD